MAPKAKTSGKQKKAGGSKFSAKAAAAKYKVSKIHQSKTVSAGNLPGKFSRADLEFHGVEHAGASYEGRVFINNPKANEKTAKTPANGYAGSFHIFGHGGCFGDIGHCEVNKPRRDYDPRLSHPLLPIKKTLVATEAIRRALSKGSKLNVTVVPVVSAWNEKTPTDDVFKYDKIRVITYD
ncbi:MAG: hypothetical protein ACREDR_16270 [Blastocatellia bacterium]